MKGLDSSANLLPARSTLAQHGGARSDASRFPDLSKGVSGVGPLISKQHTVQALVCFFSGHITPHSVLDMIDSEDV